MIVPKRKLTVVSMYWLLLPTQKGTIQTTAHLI
jgi:hypothetical protein